MVRQGEKSVKGKGRMKEESGETRGGGRRDMVRQGEKSVKGKGRKKEESGETGGYLSIFEKFFGKNGVHPKRGVPHLDSTPLIFSRFLEKYYAGEL